MINCFPHVYSRILVKRTYTLSNHTPLSLYLNLLYRSLCCLIVEPYSHSLAIIPVLISSVCLSTHPVRLSFVSRFIVLLDSCLDYCLDFRLQLASPWTLLFAGFDLWTVRLLFCSPLDIPVYRLSTPGLSDYSFALWINKSLFQVLSVVCAWFRSPPPNKNCV